VRGALLGIAAQPGFDAVEGGDQEHTLWTGGAIVERHEGLTRIGSAVGELFLKFKYHDPGADLVGLGAHGGGGFLELFLCAAELIAPIGQRGEVYLAVIGRGAKF
jgi:hypothetical protein